MRFSARTGSARRGRVGPVTNISTDYRLLEAHGIVNVVDAGGGRAFLDVVKSEVIEGGLQWLEASLQSTSGTDLVAAAGVARDLRTPSDFETPEASRMRGRYRIAALLWSALDVSST